MLLLLLLLLLLLVPPLLCVEFVVSDLHHHLHSLSPCDFYNNINPNITHEPVHMHAHHLPRLTAAGPVLVPTTLLCVKLL